MYFDSGLYVYGNKYPTDSGSVGQFLQTNGAGVLSWATASGSTPGLAAVTAVGDTTSDAVTFTGGITVTNGAVLNTNTFPTDQGSSGEYLQTNGAGALSWQPISVATPTLAAVTSAGSTTGEALTLNGSVNFTSTILASGNAGTAGQVLSSNGGGAPTWVDQSGGGSQTLQQVLDEPSGNTSTTAILLQDNTILSWGVNQDLQVEHRSSDNFSWISQKNSSGTLYSMMSFSNASLPVTRFYYDNTEVARTNTLGLYVNRRIYFNRTDTYIEGPSSGVYLDAFVQGQRATRTYANGDFHAFGDVGASVTTLSDPKLKMNFQKVHIDWLLFNNVSAYTFQWKKTGVYDFGFNAQEVIDNFPLLAKFNENFDALVVKNLSITALHHEGLKDHEKRIKELEDEVELLSESLQYHGITR